MSAGHFSLWYLVAHLSYGKLLTVAGRMAREFPMYVFVTRAVQ
jgi:hypothetical protein